MSAGPGPLGPLQRGILGDPRWHDAGTAEAGLAALREEIAHELAERIRKTPVQDLPGVNPEHQHFVRFGFDRAADAIDPEIE